MDGQINRNERYKSTRYFYKCKFINVYINSFSIKNNYLKLLKAECTRPRLLKCDLCPGRVLRWRTKKRSACCCCCGLRGLRVWSNSAHILNKNCLIIASPHLAHSHGPTPSHQPGCKAGPVLNRLSRICWLESLWDPNILHKILTLNFVREGSGYLILAYLIKTQTVETRFSNIIVD